MNIITYPNPILKQKSQEINTEQILDKNFQHFIKDMKKTMLKKDGIGLAAPQIGKNIRIFTINTDDGSQAFINPKILKKSWRKSIMEEGCLSVPNVYKKIKRPVKISVKYLDEQGKKHKVKISGLIAKVFQHEFDHLEGILIIDK
jgi:peptide deformylase